MSVYSTTCGSGAGGHPHASEPADTDDPASPPASVLIAGSPDGAVRALPPTSGASAEARAFATATLRSWSLPDLVDDAIVIVSELVTNAVRHGLPPYAAAAGDRPIRLTVVRQGRFVVFVVSDPSDRDPRVRAADDVCENGRGLHVIEALSRVWGWTPLPGSGKAVWAALPIH